MKNLKQIIDDISDEEFENFSTYAFLELVARDMDANPDNLVITDDQFFAEIDDLIGDAKNETLSSDDVVIETVSADFKGKDLPDVTELTDKTLKAIVMLTRQDKHLDALSELLEVDQDIGRYDK